MDVRQCALESLGGLGHAGQDQPDPTLASAAVLLTGHTGFKGSWLAFWLHHLGAEVTGIAMRTADHQLFNCCGSTIWCRRDIADLRDANAVAAAVAEAQPEVVLHLTAQTSVQRSAGRSRREFRRSTCSAPCTC